MKAPKFLRHYRPVIVILWGIGVLYATPSFTDYIASPENHQLTLYMLIFAGVTLVLGGIIQLFYELNKKKN